MKAIQLKARAKINISLDILGRRENGYHDVEMIMQTIGLYDKLNMSVLDENQILIKTNIPYLPVDERNLVYKIIRYMKEKYSIPSGVQVDLFKMIPIAAGLAGGSSDAAAT
ncbi:MAG: 4-(cytidine 5'-diphospho)-2-C-methyl-D-erythritol kinase, partial [Vallitaleaceae bacterium]|nr:4-(cytidine 5'-diphospho)-2-C-methyl-D-erythritol kinase [Vallitaleaceae bacterium]